MRGALRSFPSRATTFLVPEAVTLALRAADGPNAKMR
jgi:hypothetical protein